MDGEAGRGGLRLDLLQLNRADVIWQIILKISSMDSHPVGGRLFTGRSPTPRDPGGPRTLMPGPWIQAPKGPLLPGDPAGVCTHRPCQADGRRVALHERGPVWNPRQFSAARAAGQRGKGSLVGSLDLGAKGGDSYLWGRIYYAVLTDFGIGSA